MTLLMVFMQQAMTITNMMVVIARGTRLSTRRKSVLVFMAFAGWGYTIFYDDF